MSERPARTDVAPGGRGAVMVIGGAEDKFRDKLILSRFATLRRRRRRPRRRDLDRVLAGRGRDRALPRAVRGSRDRTRRPACGPRSARRRTTPTSRTSLARGHRRLPHRRQPVAAHRRWSRARGSATPCSSRTTAAPCSPAPARARARWRATWSRSASRARRRRTGWCSSRPGWASSQGVVIDQHFEQRGRIGRLLALVAQSPVAPGDRPRRGHLRDRLSPTGRCR